MRFKKIILILLGLFMIVNGLLFYLWDEQANTMPTNPGFDILKVLKKNDIKYQQAPSNRHLSLQSVAASNHSDLNRWSKELEQQAVDVTIDTQLTVTFQKPITITKQNSRQQIVQTDSQFVDGKSYVQDITSSDFFYQQVADYPVFDSAAMLRLEVKDNQLLGYKLTRLDDLQVVGESYRLISQKEAWETAFTSNQLQKKDQIITTQLGYAYVKNVKNYRLYVPVWQLMVQNNQGDKRPIRINAVNNTVISSASGAV